ncbi:hypothetical protein, partial [Bradyrhizobium sp.]
LALKDSSGDLWKPNGDETFTYYEPDGSVLSSYKNWTRETLDQNYPDGVTEIYQHSGEPFPWEK